MTLDPAKCALIREEFNRSQSKEEIYSKIIEWGNRLPPFDPQYRVEENQIFGCQSLMYLHAELKEGRLYFSADSDALISKGLASLLIFLYSGEEPLTIIKSPPLLFQELEIISSLTPGRMNGFASLYQRMKAHAVKVLLEGKS